MVAAVPCIGQLRDAVVRVIFAFLLVPVQGARVVDGADSDDGR